MNKYQRIGLGVLIGVVSFSTLYFGTLFVLPNIINLNDYKEKFASSFEKQTGFKFSCEDIKLKRTLSPYLRVDMHHTLFLYPNDEVFLKIKDSELNVKLFPLLFKKVVVKDAKLTRPIINITLYDDFSTSLDKYLKNKVNTKIDNFELIVKDTLCERYKIKINDETTDKLFHLEGDNLLLKNIDIKDKIHFLLKGSLYEGTKEYLNYDLDITSSFFDHKGNFTFSPFKTIYESEIKGFIKGKLNIDKNKNVVGFLNADNISLKADDIVLSDNSVDLIFNGSEAEIKSILHTSKTDTADIRGKFSFGKKKYIDLTSKARNVNLANLAKVLSIISTSLNIKNELKNIKVDGLLDADFSLSSDFKKLKSSGNAKIINANFLHSNLPYKATNLNANINLDDNKILIKDANVIVNSTPLSLTGIINEDVSVELNAKSENLNLPVLVSIFKLDLPFDIKKGQISFSSKITGKLDKTIKIDAATKLANISFIEKKSKQVVNVKNADAKLLYEPSKYIGEIVCSDLSTNYNNKYIKSDNFKILFDDKKITIPENTVKIVNSDLKLSGSILKNSDVQFSFLGDIFASDIALFINDYFKQPYKAVGKIKTKGELVSKNGDVDLKLQLNADANNYISYAVIKELLNKKSLFDVNLNLKNNEVSLKDISLYENESADENKILNVSGKLKLDKNIILENVKVQVPQKLSFSTNFLGGEDVSLNANVILNNTFDNLKLSGTANILSCNIKKYLTAIRNAELIFSGNIIKIVAPDVQINNSKLNILADASMKKEEKINLSNVQLHCAKLDLNSLIEIIQRESNPFTDSFFNVKNGIATISDFSVLDLKAKDISTDFQFENNILKLSNISANAYMGSIVGNVNYDVPQSMLEIMLNGKSINMKDILYDLCKISDNIAGSVDFSTNISLVTGEYNDVLNSIKGNLDFNSINGKMGTLGKFEYYLYAQNLIYHGLLKTTLNRIADIFTKDNTAQYRNANGTLSFLDGYMSTDSVKTIGNDMSLYVKGRHNLITNQANIDIYGRISDEITNKLGSFGNISISDLLDNKGNKTNNNILVVPQTVADEIPSLYNRNIEKTKLFKVNILGSIDSLSAINSFMWLIPQPENSVEEETPTFSDMLYNL